jgi:hypothetical protein
MSLLRHRADIRERTTDVRFVPKAAIADRAQRPGCHKARDALSMTRGPREAKFGEEKCTRAFGYARTAQSGDGPTMPCSQKTPE